MALAVIAEAEKLLIHQVVFDLASGRDLSLRLSQPDTHASHEQKPSEKQPSFLQRLGSNLLCF